MKRIGTGLAFLCMVAVALGDADGGLTLQVYPAGIMTEAEVEFELDDAHAFFLRAGYNFTDRRDWGKHDDEEGGGPGVTLGYRRSLNRPIRGFAFDDWFIGGRVDIWFLDIDWEDTPPERPRRTGSSDVVVLQPTAEVGRTFHPAEQTVVQLFLALGAEVNVATDGEQVGEGAILLAGFSLRRAF